jgi:ribonuclease BN (tRNA processing enzyme)
VGLTLTVLGCDGSYPGPGGAASGYLVRSEATTVWLDAGSGTLANLQRHVGFDAVDAIVLSHSHVDHWQDVQGYHVAVAHVVERDGPVPVYAPADVLEKLERTQPAFALCPVTDGGRCNVGDLAFTFSRTDHGNETLAARVESGGRVLGYSADSGPGWSLEALGSGIDLAVCEATFLQDREGSMQHLSARQAGVTAKAAGARRLVTTHTWPTIDRAAVRAEAEAAFGGPVEVAAIDAVYTV